MSSQVRAKPAAGRVTVTRVPTLTERRREARRARRKVGQTSPDSNGKRYRHGTAAGWTLAGCRCALCEDAHYRITGRVRSTVTAGHKHRRRMAPIYAGTGLYAAAWASTVIPDGTHTAVAAAGLGAVGLEAWTRRRSKAMPSGHRRYMWSVWGGASALLVAAPTLGVGPPMPGLLGLGVLAGGVPWWWHHRIRARDAVVEPDDVAEPLQVWDDLVAVANGPLPGSRLDGWAELDGDVDGWEAIVQLNRGGGVTAATAVTMLGRIALAYGKATANVVLEPLLSAEQDQARLLVLNRNPLQRDQTFTGPSLDPSTGRLVAGIHADGTPAYWQMWRPKWGACHGMIAGTTGAGKSALLQLLLAEARHSGLVVPWLADPENGSNAWKDHVGCYAGSIPRIRRQLQSAEAMMEDRRRRWSKQRVLDDDGQTVRRDTSKFTPTPDDPQILLIIDEAPEVLADPECKRIVATIGKRGRKWGVSMVIVTQIPSLAELGNDLAVRSMLSSVNVVMFRTSDKLSSHMGSLVRVDPHTLPEKWPDGSSTAGLGYMGTGTRMAPLRGLWVPDGHDWATTGRPAVLGAADADAAGDYYAQWRDLLDVDPDDDEADAEAPRGARAVDPARVQVVKVGVGTAQESIRRYLAARPGDHVTSGTIADALDIPLSTVSSALKRLAADGRVRFVRHGQWTADLPDEAQEAEEVA